MNCFEASPCSLLNFAVKSETDVFVRVYPISNSCETQWPTHSQQSLRIPLQIAPVELTKQKKLIGSGEIWKKLKNLKNLKEISCSTAAV